MAEYRNELNDVVIDLPDDHDIELGPQWVKAGESNAKSKSTSSKSE